MGPGDSVLFRFSMQKSAGSAVFGTVAVLQNSAGQKKTLFDEQMPAQVAQMYMQGPDLQDPSPGGLGRSGRNFFS